MVRDGEMAIREMKRLDENIADPGISADIVRLEQVSARIFDEVRTHPEKLPQIRRFLDYYLPTTLKLLNAYDLSLIHIWQHTSLYETPYGELSVDIQTSALRHNLSERGGLLEIKYSIAVEHTVTGRNSFKIRVKRK